MERTILLKLKNNLNTTDLKVIVLDYQNNYVKNSSTMSNVAENFIF